MTELEQLAARYQNACLAAYREAKTLHYPADAWLRMIADLGAWEAALVLTTPGLRIQTGFWELVRIDRVDLTVEQSVLDPEWAGLFDPHPDNQAEARRRLEEVGVRV